MIEVSIHSTHMLLSFTSWNSFMQMYIIALICYYKSCIHRNNSTMDTSKVWNAFVVSTNSCKDDNGPLAHPYCGLWDDTNNKTICNTNETHMMMRTLPVLCKILMYVLHTFNYVFVILCVCVYLCMTYNSINSYTFMRHMWRLTRITNVKWVSCWLIVLFSLQIWDT